MIVRFGTLLYFGTSILFSKPAEAFHHIPYRNIVLPSTRTLSPFPSSVSFFPFEKYKRGNQAFYSSSSSKARNTDQDQNSKRKRIVVVGGGVGGLATAARIASQKEENYEVIILEKNVDKMGGRCGSFFRDIEGYGSFRHERGPSLLLLKDVYFDLFNECWNKLSSKVDDKDPSEVAKRYGLEIQQCLPAYQVVFDSGERVRLGFPRNGTHDSKVAEMLKKEDLKSRAQMDRFEPDGSKKWDAYMRAASAFLDCGLPNFIEEKLDIQSFPNFLIESLRDGARSWPLKPHSDMLDAIFVSDEMKAMASFQDLYVGLSPYRTDEFFGGVIGKTAPAVFSLLASIELHPTNDKAGVFAPIGGFHAVSKALEKLALDCGVQVRNGKIVTKIMEDGVYFENSISYSDKEENKTEFLHADLVICNADLPFSTKCLIEDKVAHGDGIDKNIVSNYDWDDSFDYSSGVIAFHWSIRGTCHELDTHNVFLSTSGGRNSIENSWALLGKKQSEKLQLHEDKWDPEPFNFYLHRATASDKTAAPNNCDAIMVLVPCRTLVRFEDLASLPRDEALAIYKNQFGEEYITFMRDAVIKRLETVGGDVMTNLRSNIIDEVVDTPGTYADYYNLAAGTPFALSHGFGQLSITRPGPQSSNLKNVIFVGAGTRPGNGVPLVLLGAKSVTDIAMNMLRNKA